MINRTDKKYFKKLWKDYLYKYYEYKKKGYYKILNNIEDVDDPTIKTDLYNIYFKNDNGHIEMNIVFFDNVIEITMSMDENKNSLKYNVEGEDILLDDFELIEYINVYFLYTLDYIILYSLKLKEIETVENTETYKHIKSIINNKLKKS